MNDKLEENNSINGQGLSLLREFGEEVDEKDFQLERMRNVDRAILDEAGGSLDLKNVLGAMKKMLVTSKPMPRTVQKALREATIIAADRTLSNMRTWIDNLRASNLPDDGDIDFQEGRLVMLKHIRDAIESAPDPAYWALCNNIFGTLTSVPFSGVTEAAMFIKALNISRGVKEECNCPTCKAARGEKV